MTMAKMMKTADYFSNVYSDDEEEDYEDSGDIWGGGWERRDLTMILCGGGGLLSSLFSVQDALGLLRIIIVGSSLSAAPNPNPNPSNMINGRNMDMNINRDPRSVYVTNQKYNSLFSLNRTWFGGGGMESEKENRTTMTLITRTTTLARSGVWVEFSICITNFGVDCHWRRIIWSRRRGLRQQQSTMDTIQW